MQSQPGPESPRANPKDKDQGPEGHKGQNEGFRVYSRGKPLGLGYSLSVEKQAYAGCLALSSMGSMATAIGKSTMSGAQRQNHSQYPNSFYLLSRYVAAGQIQGANEAAIRARCHAPSRDDLPGCGEHACGSVRRPEPRAERWRLAVRGQSRSSSFHPSTVSMIWQKAKVQRWVDQTKQPCLVAQEAQTARNQTEGWRCKKRKQHARKTPRNHGRCTIRSHVLMSLSTVVFASVVRCASRSFL